MLKCRTLTGDGFFDGITFRPVAGRVDGTPYHVELPLRYHESSMIMGHFPAPAARLQSLLPSRRLVPVPIVPGLGVLTLVAFEHRRVDGLEPYEEVVVMVPVRLRPAVNVPLLPLLWPHRFDDLGFHVVHLPVTQASAWAAGIDIWGFPKTLAEITVETVGGRRRARWRADGRDVLALDVAWPPRFDVQCVDYQAYPVRSGRVLPTAFQTRGPYHLSRRPGRQASFALGDHPIADALRGLGIWRLSVGHAVLDRGVSLLYGPGVALPA